ncbi:MAG: hypothetical protein IT458_01810 [Planctomycetes bacterium]|nr:hypothetical protein [Planctomycetota bacterium]
MAEVLRSVEYVYIDTGQLSDSEFEHLFMSRALKGILAKARLLDPSEDEAYITVPCEAFSILGTRRRLVTFGGRGETRGCWAMRYSGGGRWEFAGRSRLRARVSISNASWEELRVLAEILLRMNSRRQEGLVAWFSMENTNYVLHIYWATPSGLLDGQVSSLRIVGFDGRAAGQLSKFAPGTRLRQDQEWRLQVDPPLDHPLVIVLNGAGQTAVATLERLSRAGEQRRRENGIPRNAEALLAAVGNWTSSVVKVEIIDVKRVESAGRQANRAMERYVAIVLEDRWWGVMSDPVWVGERIRMFNHPTGEYPKAPGMPLGTVRVGDILWVDIGFPMRGWRGLGNGVHIKE